MRIGRPLVQERGDGAFVIQFPQPFSLPQHERLLALVAALDRAPPPAVVDIVPGHTQILVVFDPAAGDADAIAAHLTEACRLTVAPAVQTAPVVTIPVCFSAALAPDLDSVATAAAMTRSEAIARFCERTYRCTVVGFRPGFPYLIGLDARLHAGRHATPRVHVPAGSVGIAGAQTGIYPNDGPGGWQIIARTPVALFDTSRATALVQPGCHVRFVEIDARAFAKLAAK